MKAAAADDVLSGSFPLPLIPVPWRRAVAFHKHRFEFYPYRCFLEKKLFSCLFKLASVHGAKFSLGLGLG